MTVLREASCQDVPPTSMLPLAPDDEADGRLVVWIRAGLERDTVMVLSCRHARAMMDRCGLLIVTHGKGAEEAALRATRSEHGGCCPARQPRPHASSACSRAVPEPARVGEGCPGTRGARVQRDTLGHRDSTMHILSLRRLREFWAEHPEAEASLRSWYRVAKQARWQRFTDVRAHYRRADQVGKFTVFDIAGNAYRLITVIHFNTGRVYVRRVLTHAAYDRGTWRDD